MNVSCTDVLHALQQVRCFVLSWILVCMYDQLMPHFLCSLGLPVRHQHSNPFAACSVASALQQNLRCSSTWEHIQSSSTVHCARKPSMWSSCWTNTCRSIMPLRSVCHNSQKNLKFLLFATDFEGKRFFQLVKLVHFIESSFNNCSAFCFNFNQKLSN